ncbi:MAG: ABC transporter permease [Hyphomicrobiaceae bacterium]|nr:ABC transporter permease [Hyphomicrobiaceae bacterium]
MNLERTSIGGAQAKLPQLVIRPEFENTNLGKAHIGDVARRLSIVERVWNNNGFRKSVILLGFVAVWEIYFRIAGLDPLLFPPFSAVAVETYNGFVSGVLPERIWYSLKVLLMGYVLGMVLAAVFVFLATMSRIGSDVLSTATAMFNPLPAIALVPLAMLWFPLGVSGLLFVLVHSVLWAVALSTHTGFKNVSSTLKMIGQNYGLRSVTFVRKILVPAAFPAILSGMKIGWAFAWRTLIGAELVFGATSGGGGLGWHIFAASQNIETAQVFSGLFMVILIGIIIENVIFRNVELRTVNRWGMQR